MSDKKTRPSATKLPYGPGGRLLPNGPRYSAPMAAPDILKYINTGQWVRHHNQDGWTNEDQRVVVLTFLSDFIKTNEWPNNWHIVERNTDDQSSATFSKYPRLVITMIRQSDGTEFEIGIDFYPSDLETDANFRARLDVAGDSLHNQHLQG